MKLKILIAVVVVLCVANAIAVGMLWFKPQQDSESRIQPHGGGPGEFVIKELKLTPEQTDTYNNMRHEHHDAVEKIKRSLNDKKDSLYMGLQVEITDSTKSRLLKDISELEVQIDLTTYNHFKDFKAILNEQQQVRFNEIIKDVFNIIRSQPAMGRDRQH